MSEGGYHGAKLNPNKNKNYFITKTYQRTFTDDLTNFNHTMGNSVRTNHQLVDDNLDEPCLKEKTPREEFPCSEQQCSTSAISDNIISINHSELLPAGLLKVDVNIEEMKVKAILDTGASSNMVRKSFVSKLKYEMIRGEREMKGIGEEIVKTLGYIQIPVVMYDIEMGTTPFHVVEDSAIKIPMLLGRKFCSKAKLVIDLGNNRIRKNFNDGGSVDIYLDENQTVLTSIHEDIKVCVAEETVVTTDMKKVPVNFSKENRLLFHPEKLLYFEENMNNETVEGVSGVLKVDEENPFVLVKPKLDKKNPRYKLKRGQVIGTVCTIVEFEEGLQCTVNWNLDMLNREVDIGAQLTDEQRNLLFNVLLEKKNALSKDEHDIGLANVTPQKIILTDKPRRFAEPLNEEIDNQCKQLEFQDVIEPCNSPYSSPIVPVRKWVGSLNFASITAGS